MEDHLQRLVDESAIQGVINRLFVSTDNKDWESVKGCFYKEVRFDMTSLAGGEPRTLTPQQIVDAWEEGLKEITALHHQTGNFMLEVVEDEAHVFCYGTATHYKPNPSNNNTRTFVGSYDFGLARIEGEWKIDQFKFNLKYIDGNTELK